MTDPKRLFTHGTATEARLLASALDEPPPRDLLDRTLLAVGAGATVATVSSAATASSASASALAAKAGALGTAGAKGSVLGFAFFGGVAGLFTVGALEVASRLSDAPTVAARPAVTLSATVAASRPAPVTRSRANSVLADEPAPEPAKPSGLDGEPRRGSQSPSVEAIVAPRAAPSARASTLADEIALLDEVRSAIRAGDRPRALALLRRYDRENPKGQMTREAALLHVEASNNGAPANSPNNP